MCARPAFWWVPRPAYQFFGPPRARPRMDALASADDALCHVAAWLDDPRDLAAFASACRAHAALDLNRAWFRVCTLHDPTFREDADLGRPRRDPRTLPYDAAVDWRAAYRWDDAPLCWYAVRPRWLRHALFCDTYDWRAIARRPREGPPASRGIPDVARWEAALARGGAEGAWVTVTVEAGGAVQLAAHAPLVADPLELAVPLAWAGPPPAAAAFAPLLRVFASRGGAAVHVTTMEADRSDGHGRWEGVDIFHVQGCARAVVLGARLHLGGALPPMLVLSCSDGAYFPSASHHAPRPPGRGVSPRTFLCHLIDARTVEVSSFSLASSVGRVET